MKEWMSWTWNKNQPATFIIHRLCAACLSTLYCNYDDHYHDDDDGQGMCMEMGFPMQRNATQPSHSEETCGYKRSWLQLVLIVTISSYCGNFFCWELVSVSLEWNIKYITTLIFITLMLSSVECCVAVVLEQFAFLLMFLLFLFMFRFVFYALGEIGFTEGWRWTCSVSYLSTWFY